MKAAFNTLIYPGTELNRAICEIGEAGYEGIELFPKDIDCLNVAPETVVALRERLRDHDLEVACLMAGFLDENHSLEYVQKALDVGGALSCKYIFVLPPDRNNGDWPEFIRLVKAACKYAEEKNICLTMHHHAGTIIETLGEIERLLDEVDSEALGICFDCAHYLLCNEDLDKGIRLLGKRIKYAHIKDLSWSGPCKVGWPNLSEAVESFRDLGEGKINLKGYVDVLKETGYAGWVTVEIENLRSPTTSEHVRKNLIQLNTLLRGDVR